jgi:hypothetical protein
MAEIRVVRARGDGFTRGVQIGRELQDLIQRSVDYYHLYLHRRGVSSDQLSDLLSSYLVAAETWQPESMSVLKGMSVGATIPTLELFAINAFEELEPLLESPEGGLLFLQRKEGYVEAPAPAGGGPGAGNDTPPSPTPGRCSSLTVRLPETTLLAHNEHWLAGDADNVAVIVDLPVDGRPPVASPTVVCCLPAVGMNAYGGAQGIGSLTASDDGVGVPRVLVSRHSLDARDRSDAVARAAMSGRAGGYGHVFGFPDDAFFIETTGKQHRVLEGPGPHTNHYEDPELAALAPPASDGSRARLARLRELLDECDPKSGEDLMDVMRDHGSSPQSVCLHPDPAEGDEASACLFSMIADVGARRMWVAAGNPCERPYEEIELDELAG